MFGTQTWDSGGVKRRPLQHYSAPKIEKSMWVAVSHFVKIAQEKIYIIFLLDKGWLKL